MGIVIILRTKQKWRRNLRWFSTKKGKETRQRLPNQSINHWITWECADFAAYPPSGLFDVYVMIEALKRHLRFLTRYTFFPLFNFDMVLGQIFIFIFKFGSVAQGETSGTLKLTVFAHTKFPFYQTVPETAETSSDFSPEKNVLWRCRCSACCRDISTPSPSTSDPPTRQCLAALPAWSRSTAAAARSSTGRKSAISLATGCTRRCGWGISWWPLSFATVTQSQPNILNQVTLSQPIVHHGWVRWCEVTLWVKKASMKHTEQRAKSKEEQKRNLQWSRCRWAVREPNKTFPWSRKRATESAACLLGPIHPRLPGCYRGFSILANGQTG